MLFYFSCLWWHRNNTCRARIKDLGTPELYLESRTCNRGGGGAYVMQQISEWREHVVRPDLDVLRL